MRRIGDAFWASDVGLGRLRSALQAVTTMVVAMAAQWVFMRTTGALQEPVPSGASAGIAAKVEFFDHATLLIGLMIAIMIGMMAGFAGPNAGTPREALVIFSWIPVPLAGSLAIGSLVGAHHILTLVVLVAVLAAGTYSRRFGQLGFLGGVLGFMGYFLGFFLRQHAGVTPADLGWLVAEIGVAAFAALVVQLTVFYPSPTRAARRALRSYRARTHLLVRACRRAWVQDGPTAGTSARRRLERQMDLCGAAALVADARIAAAARSSREGPDAPTLRRRLLDHEQALAALADGVLAEALAAGTTEEPESRVIAALDAAEQDDPAGAAMRVDGTEAMRQHPATAAALARLAAASRPWELPRTGGVSDRAPHPSPVALFGAWLPGATLISRAASTEPGPHAGRRLSPHTRAAIQMAVAGALAIVAGSAVSGYRYYWAALAAFFILVGTNNTGEQVRKAVYRVVGTLAGVILAVPIVGVAGSRPWPVLAVVLVSLFAGLYLIRVNYTLMLAGITVAIAELYVEFHEFTDQLLALRLVETMVGAAAAVLAVVVVLPLRPRHVAQVAADRYARAVDALSDPVAADALDAVDAHRRADAAYQELLATAGARHTPYGPLTGAHDADRRRLLHEARRRRRGTVTARRG